MTGTDDPLAAWHERLFLLLMFLEDLDPVYPIHLLQEAAGVRDGERFTQAYDRWAHAVDDRVRTDPAWRPVKEPTTADDPADPESSRLTEWLSRRAAGFADWVAAYAPDRAETFLTLKGSDQRVRG